MIRLLLSVFCCSVLLGKVSTEVVADEKSQTVDYTTQVKPLFVQHCYECHARDKQESGYRLDTGKNAIRGGDRGQAIVPGKSAESLLYQAITDQTDDVSAMPMEKKLLSKADRELIKNWIDQGAKYPANEKAEATRQSEHWAFQPVKQTRLPEVKRSEWVRNPIDAFVLHHLERQQLAPSLEAPREMLIRRVSLDLRGILPSPDEVEAYLADAQPGAYERMVDRFLSSPHYGERWGRHWLDLARYADSNGFTIDGPRSIWLFRDWVINAINEDLPFDQFTRDQLAGDLLPKPTSRQLVATGFHRNTLINQEGGTDKEQFRVESVVDRVNTTGAVWLGLTVGCAQCHSHKYDPLTQREYYQLFAIFNNCDEPNIKVAPAWQHGEIQSLDTRIASVTALLKKQQVHWEPVTPAKLETEQQQIVFQESADHSVLVTGDVPANDTYQLTLKTSLSKVTGIRLEALTHDSLPKKGPGLAANGNFVLNEVAVSVANDAAEQPVRLQRASADHSQVKWPIAHAIDGKPETGWAINVTSGSLNVNRTATFLFREPVTGKDGVTLTVRLHHAHKDPKYLLGRFRLSVTGTDLKSFGLDRQLAELKAKKKAFTDKTPSTMILRERKSPRQTHVMVRGDFLNLGDPVEPAVPAWLHSLPDGVTAPDRLEFSTWLFEPANPLTARVTVNRYWQRFFGKGLVTTENDFGTQGQRPSHPDLLDWLALEFRRQKWSVKAIHRLIVTSATYRQASYFSEELRERDPGNRWLGRQSRVRLDAEVIRDATLSASGLLSVKMKGPGIYPPQPEGIYVLTQNRKSWPESQGIDRHRRGIYTYFWRSSPFPFLPTFDAPSANGTCTRRPRSNTPLQALTLANDRGFVELAEGLANRILQSHADTDREKLRFAFRVCFARSPHPLEEVRLLTFVHQQREAETNTEEQSVWTAVARVLLNLDEFITRE